MAQIIKPGVKTLAIELAISNKNNPTHTKGNDDFNNKSNSGDDNNNNKNKNNSRSGRKNNK